MKGFKLDHKRPAKHCHVKGASACRGIIISPGKGKKKYLLSKF